MAIGPSSTVSTGAKDPGKFDVESPSQQRALFKTYYDKISENTFNSSSPLFSMIRRPEKKFTGNQFVEGVVLGQQAGSGSGVLPEAGGSRNAQLTMLSRRSYQRVSIQGEAVQASKNDKGAFIDATKFALSGAIKNFTNSATRQLYGDGSGILGRGNGVTGSYLKLGTNRYRISLDNTRNHPTNVTEALTAQGFIPANFEPGSIVQLVDTISDTVEDELLEITRVNKDTGTIEVTGVSQALERKNDITTGNTGRTDHLAPSEGFVLQKSYNREMQGFMYAINHTSAAVVYGIATADENTLVKEPRWNALQVDANLQSVAPLMLREMYLDLDENFGCQNGNYMFTASFLQYKKLLANLDSAAGAGKGQTYYSMKGRNSSKNAKPFYGLAVNTEHGPVPVFPDRFCPEGMVYLINTDYVKTVLRPGGYRWLQHDGHVLNREENRDSVEARYGGYGNNIIYPFAHAVLYNLDVS